MPRDTIWYDNGEHFILLDNQTIIDSNLRVFREDKDGKMVPIAYSYNSKNTPEADSILNLIAYNNRTEVTHNIYQKEKDSYDTLAGIIMIIITLAAFIFIRYAYKRAQQYIDNPEAENERDWIEIGTRVGSSPFYEDTAVRNQPAPRIEYYTYAGKDLNFSDEQITTVLNKRFPYFINLSIGEKNRFLQRHKKFMKSKLFRIHTNDGFKEMPILISATAIQLSFGLEEYLLPYYKNIHIFPQAFLGMHPTMRFLEGNVSGNDINISWKHYLEGYEKKDDGQNVGLHEMAHAYYSQNFTFEGDKDKCFVNGFTSYNISGNKVFEGEKIQNGQLFSDYALKNFQEFWAESVEIFFERPSEMKAQYEDLYESMSMLLNQRPV
jgi:MtfA peptidase